ncbi:MAG: hypothetical protein WBN88_21680 [Anderseniella sp.]
MNELPDAVNVNQQQRSTCDEQPVRHSHPECDAKQGNIQNLKIHLVGIQSCTEQKADFNCQEQQGTHACQQQQADTYLPQDNERAEELVPAARFVQRVGGAKNEKHVFGGRTKAAQICNVRPVKIGAGEQFLGRGTEHDDTERNPEIICI